MPTRKALGRSLAQVRADATTPVSNAALHVSGPDCEKVLDVRNEGENSGATTRVLTAYTNQEGKTSRRGTPRP